MTKRIFSFILAALGFILIALVFAPEAKACRDCPFPMKIGEGRWLMPNRQMEIVIEETVLENRYEELYIYLKDARTGQLVAVGAVRQRRGRKTVSVSLIDTTGHEVKGFIRFVDLDRSRIQAKFTCESQCSIRRLLE